MNATPQLATPLDRCERYRGDIPGLTPINPTRKQIKAEMLKLAGLYLAVAREEAIATLQGHADAGAAPQELVAQKLAAMSLDADGAMKLASLQDRIALELEYVDADLQRACTPPALFKPKRRALAKEAAA